MKTDWKVKKLRDVCTLINGRAFKKDEFLNSGKYAVLRVGNFFTNNHWYFSNLELDEDKYCNNGDLLYAWSASFGPRIWNGNKMIYHYHIWKVIPNNSLITKEFLCFLLEWDVDKIKMDQGTGTTMIHVSKSSMEEREISIPSIPEQQRIVGILDEAFEAITMAKENAEKNLQNAREIFEAYLQSVFAECGDGWEEKTLNQISENLDSKRIPITKNVRKSGKYPYYGASGIVDYVEGYIFDEDLLLISEDGANLLARSTPIAFSVSGKIWVNNHAHILRFKNMETQKFVEMFFALIKLDNYITGAAQPKLNQAALNSIIIPIPSIKEQHNIITKLEDLSIETKKLETIYNQKLTNLEELKKSILQKAFNGEL